MVSEVNMVSACPPQGCPRAPAPLSGPTGVHSTGPEASSAGLSFPGPQRKRRSRAQVSSSRGSLRPPECAGVVVGVRAARRAHPSRHRKGSWAHPRLGFHRRPGAASSSRCRSPGPEAAPVPSRLLSNRRRGAGEERRVVGVACILGKSCLRVPLLSFGKRYWLPESAVGGGSVCSWLSRVSFLGVWFFRGQARDSETRSPSTRLCQRC